MRHALIILPAATLVAAVLFAGSARAACEVPERMLLPAGYLTGAELMSVTKASLKGYVVGFIDGLAVSGALGTTSECLQEINPCVANKTPEDLGKAIRLYIGLRPKSLEEDAATVSFNAIHSPCLVELH